MQWNRRDVLKAGGLTAVTLGLNAFSPGIFKRLILADPGLASKKVLFIFQRGGNDGVNTLIPRGDPEYSLKNRPTLYVDPAAAIDLGNGFAQLNPAMLPLMEIFNSQSLNGVAGPGNLAIIHRVGYANHSQSHFDSQQFWENGMPGQPTFEEGMIYRLIANTMDPKTNTFSGASISGTMMVALKGRYPIPTISSPQTYSFVGTSTKVKKFLGTLPTAPVGSDGTGMLGFYGGPRDFPSKIYRDDVYGTGTVLANSINIVQNAIKTPYTVENGAAYPSTPFGTKLHDCAMLFKRTPVRVLGVNFGGWDTHTNQRTYHDGILKELATGIQALYRDLQSQWQDLVIFTMTEFGRTSIENGSRGTDHAFGCVMFVAGGGVNGGVYNCDSTTWKAGDLFSQDGRYVADAKDYRDVIAEITRTHLGVDPATLNLIIPSYAQAAAKNPNLFKTLGIMKTA